MLIRWRSDIIAMLDERKHPYWWVEGEISAGRIKLLGNDDAVIGVARKDYPGGLVELHGMFACGDLKAIGALVEQACEAGKAAGFDIAAIESREGWAREFRGLGFEVEQVRIVKELK